MPVPSIKTKTILIIRLAKQETPQFTVDAFVLRKITELISSERVMKAEWPHIEKIDLADPRYNEPAPIDILLGAEVFSSSEEIKEKGLIVSQLPSKPCLDGC